jgi:hypothetical protein
MVFSFGPLIKAVFPKGKREKLRVKKGQERAYSREYIWQAARVIKQAVKEPDELPAKENVPAIRELFENGAQSP